ncbi:MAG: hypothetical protein R2695_04845 [Acidimicrobiales bacterium]
MKVRVPPRPDHRRAPLDRAAPSALAEIDQKKQVGQAARLDCFGLSNLTSDGVCGRSRDGPRAVAFDLSRGYGLYLEPGSVIVSQIHYHFDHNAPGRQLRDHPRRRPQPTRRHRCAPARSLYGPAEDPLHTEESQSRPKAEASIDGFTSTSACGERDRSSR